MWDHQKIKLAFDDLLWLQTMPHLTELVIDLPGARHACMSYIVSITRHN